AAVPNVMAGEDVTFTVTASNDADIIVKDGFEVVAQAKGEGIDTPVTVTISDPAAGKHLYEVYANMQGLGKSDSITLPAVTVYDFTNYELNVEEEITIEVGE